MSIDNDPTTFLVDEGTPAVTRDLDAGRSSAEIQRRDVERSFRHHMARLIRDARCSAGVSQQCAAESWAAKQPHVSRFEKDPGNAHAATLISYLSSLGADIDLHIRLGDHRCTLAVRDGRVEASTTESSPS